MRFPIYAVTSSVEEKCLSHNSSCFQSPTFSSYSWLLAAGIMKLSSSCRAREAADKGASSGTKGWKIQAQKDAFNKGQVLEEEVTDGDLKCAKWRRSGSLMDLIVNSVRKQNIRLISRPFSSEAELPRFGIRPHLDRNIWTRFVSQLCLIHQHDGVLHSGHPGLCTTQETGGARWLVDQARPP